MRGADGAVRCAPLLYRALRPTAPRSCALVSRHADPTLHHLRQCLQTTATEYCAELLRLLQSNDVINARFLWNRIADSVKVDPQLRAVWGIGAASLSETRGDPAELTKALSAFAWQPPVRAR